MSQVNQQVKVKVKGRTREVVEKFSDLIRLSQNLHIDAFTPIYPNSSEEEGFHRFLTISFTQHPSAFKEV